MKQCKFFLFNTFITLSLVSVLTFSTSVYGLGGGSSGGRSTYHKRHGVQSIGVHYHANPTPSPKIIDISNDPNAEEISPGVWQCKGGYILNLDDEKCDQCEAGTYAAGGDQSCATTPAGYYSPAGAAEPTICPDGTYQPEVGQSDCMPVDEGYEPAVPTPDDQVPCTDTTTPGACGCEATHVADGLGSCTCAQGYVEKNNVCVEDKCATFVPNDCALSCDTETGEITPAPEGTSCGKGIATCDGNGKCNCPFDEAWLTTGFAHNKPTLGADGHTCCMDGYEWTPGDDPFYDTTNIPVCGCPFDFTTESEAHLASDGTTCCANGHSYIDWTTNPDGDWGYIVEDFKTCGCPSDNYYYMNATYDAETNQCYNPDTTVAFCARSDELGNCLEWDTCPKDHYNLIDAKGKVSAIGACVTSFVYPSDTYTDRNGVTKVYGSPCQYEDTDSTSMYVCETDHHCEAFNAYGECLRWRYTDYNATTNYCCTEQDVYGRCTAVTKWTASYSDYRNNIGTPEACVEVPTCPNGQQYLMGKCVSYCDGGAMRTPNGTCVCTDSESEYMEGYGCVQKCKSWETRSEESPSYCDPKPCEDGYFRTASGECKSCYDPNPYEPAYGYTQNTCEVCGNRDMFSSFCAPATCPNGYFHNKDTGQCVSCTTQDRYPSSDCSVCSNRTNVNGYCGLTTCPSGYFNKYDGGQCYSCNDSQTYSATPKDRCESCYNRILENNYYCKLITCNQGQSIVDHACTCPDKQTMNLSGYCVSCYAESIFSASETNCGKCSNRGWHSTSGNYNQCTIPHCGAINNSTSVFTDLNGNCHYCAEQGSIITTQTECNRCTSTTYPRSYEEIIPAQSSISQPSIGICERKYRLGSGRMAIDAHYTDVDGSYRSCADTTTYTSTQTQCNLCKQRVWTQTSSANTSINNPIPAYGTCTHKCAENEFADESGNCVSCSDTASHSTSQNECSRCSGRTWNQPSSWDEYQETYSTCVLN